MRVRDGTSSRGSDPRLLSIDGDITPEHEHLEQSPSRLKADATTGNHCWKGAGPSARGIRSVFVGEFYGPQNYFHLASALQNLGLQRDFLSALWESGAAHPGPSVGSAWSSCLLPSTPFSKQSSSLIRTFLGFCHHSSRNRSRFFIPGAETGSDGGRRVGLSRVSENLGAREGD